MSNLKRFIALSLALWYVDAETCESQYCHEFAKKVLISMNSEMDPCQDFYEYACGSWKLSNPLPEGEFLWSADNLIEKRNDLRILDIVSGPEMPEDIEPVKKAKRFYRSCMDDAALQKTGIASLVKIIDGTGGWPMAMSLSQWEKQKVHWQKVDSAYCKLDGSNALFTVVYTHDDVDLTRNVLFLSEESSYPLLKTNNDGLIDPDTAIDAFVETITQTVKTVKKYKNATLDTKQFVNDVLEVLLFEINLRNITKTDVKKEKKDVEKMTIGSLQQWYDSIPRENSSSQIDWMEVFQAPFDIVNETLTPEEPVFVSSKENLRNLAMLLDRTSQRTIVNYVQWLFASRYISFTTEKLRNLHNQLYTRVFNMTIQVPRWKQCLEKIDMDDAIAYEYVKRYVSERGKIEAKDMVQRIKEQIALGIKRTHWLNGTMKVHMKEKLDAVREQVGYPDWYNDDALITDAYEELEIGDDFFENVLNYGRFKLLSQASHYFEPVDKDVWFEYATTLNAFYSERDNVIVVPAAEFQEPYFTPGLPDAVNYGTIGFIIGHELSHGFDHVGINYDKHGNKITKKLQTLLNIYAEKAECFVDQYNAFTLNHTDENGNPITINGNLTENENIADSTGIKIAYSAYKKKVSGSTQLRLPKLQRFSSDQLFFLSYATGWCTTVHPFYEEHSTDDEVHSPANFRIIGSLANMKEFATAFHCKRGSPMNPTTKCAIWS